MSNSLMNLFLSQEKQTYVLFYAVKTHALPMAEFLFIWVKFQFSNPFVFFVY